MQNLLIGLFLGILLGLAIPPIYKWMVKKFFTKADPVDTVKTLLALPLITVLLQSCGHFPDGTSVWAELTWLVPLFPFIGAVIFGIVAYRKSKSGSEQQTPGGYKSYKANVPLYKIGQFWFSVVLLIATAVIIAVQNAAK